jgi:hypothetical protein
VTDLEIDYTNQMLYASTYGRGVWKTELNGAIPVCLYPVHVRVKNVSTYGADASWEMNTAEFTGFEYSFSTSALPPSGGTFTANMWASVTGLGSNISYYFHVRAVCSGFSSSQWITVGPFKTAPACSQNFADSGGTGSNYSSMEDITWVICPSSPCSNVKVTFSSFNVESGWDALYVFNGLDITAPQFSSTNGITNGGFPAGGYFGTSLPGPFTSTHDSGCLTFRFMSDGFDQRAGWNASVSCVQKNPLVTNTQDSGLGSLRQALDCITSGDTITFSPSLTGQFIDITTTTLQIKKDVNMYRSPTTTIKIRAQHGLPIFNIQSGYYLSMRHCELYPDSGITGRAIVNEGILTLDNSTIYEKEVNLGIGSTIENLGSVIIKGQSEILKE